ncbi:fimbria/pilus periplasmic chaperone [Enterobacteriaceae bacterium RIT714]|nr:fimbria/pilus periplasmic chaperone [Enterobacteriaceae bacterium RIT714]
MKNLLYPLFILLLSTFNAQASIKLSSNRLIYDGAKPEVTLSLINDDTRAFLVQAWADVKGNPLLEGKPIPFMITPPLFQMEPGAENVVQLVYLGGALPTDRESLLWLNIKSIPSIKESEEKSTSKMLLAVSNRIKVFYRPAGLKALTGSVIENLKWKKGDNNTVVVTNASPFYVVMNKVLINGNAVTVSIDQNNTVVPPFGDKTFSVTGSHGATLPVTWSALNDYSLPSKDYSAKVAW